MEGLNLEDLNFDDVDAGQVFDAFAAPATDSKPADEVTIEVPSITETNNNTTTPPDSEGLVIDPESVATGSNDNQGQADKANVDTGSNSSSPQQNDSEKLYSTLATHLLDKGALSDLDPSTIKSVDDLNEAIQREADKRLDSSQQAISKAMESGAPVSQVAEVAAVISQLEGVTEEMLAHVENVDLRANLITQDFVNRGYDVQRAQVLAQRSIDAGTAVEDAKFAIKGILDSQIEKRDGLIASAKIEEEKSLTSIRDFVGSKDNSFGAVKLTDSQQQEVYDQMVTNVGDGDNAFIKYQKDNPIESRVKLESLYYLTKGLTDFSVFGNTAKTEVANDLEALLRGTSFTEDGKVNTIINDPLSSFALKDFKDLDIAD